MASLTRYYRTLGLPITASAKEIKSAYIELCKKCHPDVVKSNSVQDSEDNKVKFQEIQEAYTQLINKDGSKNIISSTTTTDYDDFAARRAGFPGRYETYYHHNSYMNRRHRQRTQDFSDTGSSGSGFDFDSYYRKRYGHDYSDYKKWSSYSGSSSSNTENKENKEGKSDSFYGDDFWHERQWNEFNRNMNYRRRMQYYERSKEQAQVRVAVFCIVVLFVSNVTFYALATPANQSNRTRSYW